MKVGIDVRMIQDFPTGIGNYLENLIKALVKLPSKHQFILVGNSGNKMEEWSKNQPRFEFITVRSKPNSVHQHFLLPFELVPLKLDLFWTTPWGASIFFWQKYALTIYDLLYRRYPEIASLKARLYEGLISKWVAKRAAVIFTISEFVKNDIEKLLGVKREKIFNIQGAAGEAYFRRHKPLKDKHLQGQALQVLKKYGISRPFFVYLGNFRPHKNLPTLLRAFAKLSTQHLAPSLVIIGDVDATGRDQDSKRLLNQIKELKLQDRAILTGRIGSDEEVAAILNEAVALVHPSFHEGFGLTVLEAMSCGCPVIAANTTSIPEVAGNAAILVDPYSVDGLSGAMQEVLTGKRQDLVQRGLERAKKFSWEKTARMVLDKFEILNSKLQTNPKF